MIERSLILELGAPFIGVPFALYFPIPANKFSDFLYIKDNKPFFTQSRKFFWNLTGGRKRGQELFLFLNLPLL